MEDCKGHYGVAMGWFLVGGLAGGCAALLLAPATGKRTRERLARKLRDTKESVTDFTDDLADTTRQIAEKASQITDKAARLAGDASAAARGVFGSLESAAKRQ
jgi:gas vesicle protein